MAFVAFWVPRDVDSDGLACGKVIGINIQGGVQRAAPGRERLTWPKDPRRFAGNPGARVACRAVPCWAERSEFLYSCIETVHLSPYCAAITKCLRLGNL
jgi:hypothetical protein